MLWDKGVGEYVEAARLLRKSYPQAEFCLLGFLDVPTSGAYHLEGRDVSRLNSDELAEVRSNKIGFVFQSFNLLPRISALANVELPLAYSRVSREERQVYAVEALKEVGLEDRMEDGKTEGGCHRPIPRHPAHRLYADAGGWYSAVRRRQDSWLVTGHHSDNGSATVTSVIAHYAMP